jgi:hypothetical protein
MSDRVRFDKSRGRVLSDSEIATVWLNCPESDYGNILKLILLTGFTDFCRDESIIPRPGRDDDVLPAFRRRCS